MSRSSTPGRPVVLGSAAACLLLLLAAPAPADALRTLADAGAANDQAAPLVALIALVAWALAAWLVLTAVVTAGAHLPGRLGAALRVLARRVAPAAVRRAVEVALGLSVVVGLAGGSPALAAPASAAPPAAGPALDWAAGGAPAAPGLDWAAPVPAAEGASPAQDLDWAAAAPAPADAAPVEATDGTVVVQPGDSLWELAEQDLAARGGPTTDAAVAQAWPSWWAANRDAVGDDPDLIQPGTPLTPPPADGSTPPAPAS